MSRARLYLLAFVGAALSTFGDAMGTESARGHRPLLADVLGTVAWALCYPVWRAMSRASGGSFVQPAAAWTVVAAILGVAIAIFYREPESGARRVLFVAVVACAVAREIVK